MAEGNTYKNVSKPCQKICDKIKKKRHSKFFFVYVEKSLK